MTFDWDTPPWLRPDDSSYMAVMITDLGGVSFNSTSVRGNTPEEALADLLMGPGGVHGVPLLPGLIGVVIREGTDVLWMAQPPIQVEPGKQQGEYNIGVDKGGAEVTFFSAKEMQQLRERLHAEYGPK